MNIKCVAGLALLCLAALAATAAAAVPGEIVRDFKPVSGYVIMPVQGEFLIDLDSGKGVAVGDLFSVIKPGEKIVHPVTKEVLGTLDEVKGLLQVTRIKSGYSYGRPLGEAKGIERGDVVRRFENVSATFWDYTGQGAAIAAELASALPNLAWTDYAAAQAARPQVPAAPGKGGSDLLFILRHDGLEVRDAAFQTLHVYPTPITPEVSAAMPLPVPAPVPAAPVAAGSLEGRLQALEQQQAALLAGRQPGEPAEAVPYKLEEKGKKVPGGVAYEATFPGFANVGEIPGIAVMADFVHDGDRTLMVATDGGKIRVFAVGEELSPLAEGTTAAVNQIASVRWWRPQPGGGLFIAATCWKEPTLESAIFALQGDKLVPVQENLSSLFGTFDRDGDGQPELLLGQSFDRSSFFGQSIREVRLVGKDELKEEKVSFALPSEFRVQGSTFADLTGDGRLETLFVHNDMLKIYSGEKEIYKSPKQMGGTLSVVTFETNPGARESIPGYAKFDVAPVAIDLDGDGIKELITIASDRSFMAAPGIGPGVRKSWLAVVKFREGMFVKGTLGEELEVPLQGLTVDAGRVLFVASEPASLLGQGGGSHLLAFPLAK